MHYNAKCTMPHTLTLAIAATLLYWLLGAVPESLILDRSIPWYTEPWRLWAAHLTHSDLGHLTRDVAGLLLVGWLYEPLIVDGMGRRYWILLGGGAVLIDLAVLTFVPELDRYCGLSGLINLLIGAGTLAAFAKPGNLVLVCFGLLVLVKVIYEQFSGDALLTNADWPAVPEAHLAGLIAGAVIQAARAGMLLSRRPRCHLGASGGSD